MGRPFGAASRSLCAAGPGADEEIIAGFAGGRPAVPRADAEGCAASPGPAGRLRVRWRPGGVPRARVKARLNAYPEV